MTSNYRFFYSLYAKTILHHYLLGCRVPIYKLISNSRGDLDLEAEAADKLPDLFSCSMDIKVSNEERPSRDPLSWSNWNPASTNVLTPFSGREELDQTLQLYGMLMPPALFPSKSIAGVRESILILWFTKACKRFLYELRTVFKDVDNWFDLSALLRAERLVCMPV